MSTTAAASTAAKTEEDKTIVGTMDVSLGVSGAVRRHTKVAVAVVAAFLNRSTAHPRRFLDKRHE